MTAAAEQAPTIRAGGIDAVFYSVTDVKRSIAFYRGLLDVRETTFENEHGAEFVLLDGNAFGVGAYSSGEFRPSGCVLFAVLNVVEAAARVPALGGKLEGEVRTFPTCQAQWCQDPDGNSFVLHQRKS
jgi:predicted enzyme related to lactoylglutathione lyase